MSMVEVKEARVLMPARLTAENGAKAAFIDEFYESVEVSCCCDNGVDDLGNTCGACHGRGVYNQRVPIHWTTIKEIYQKAVELYGTTPPAGVAEDAAVRRRRDLLAQIRMKDIERLSENDLVEIIDVIVCGTAVTE